MKNINHRAAEYSIDDIFLKRYSPRAMSGENISEEKLMTLFEAARWAPSSSNSQPWRFIYATRDMPEFQNFLSFLMEGNRTWCEKAGTLIVLLSKNTSDKNTPLTSHFRLFLISTARRGSPFRPAPLPPRH